MNMPRSLTLIACVCAAILGGPAVAGEVPIAQRPVSKPYTGVLAQYDPNRERGLGEAVPEHPEAPLRRFLYLNLKDCSEDTYSQKPGGILVLDLDDGLKPVKRINSPMMTKGATSSNSLGGVRWQHGSAVTDRMYYGYWQPGEAFMKGLNAHYPAPEEANSVIGCVDLRTDTVLWEQPVAYSSAFVVAPDGSRIYAVSHWTRRQPFISVYDARDGRFIERIPAPNAICHGGSLGASGQWLYFEWEDCVLDLRNNRVLSTKDWMRERGVADPQQTHILTMNGAETRLFHQGFFSVDFTIKALAAFGGNFLGGMVHQALSPHRPTSRLGRWTGYSFSFHPGERWLYSGPSDGDVRAIVWDNRVFPTRMVGLMGVGLSSRPGSSVSAGVGVDFITGKTLGCHNKSGAFISADGRVVYTSDSWCFDSATWKPVGMMRDEKGQVIRCSKMNEVHFRGEDVVYVGQRYGYGRYREPEKIFPPPTDAALPGPVAGLEAAPTTVALYWGHDLGGREYLFKGVSFPPTHSPIAELTLRWQPATDDDGVQRYAVWRDGELLGNTLGVNPGRDPVLSAVDQAEYDKQLGPFVPNTFTVRYLTPGHTYRFEVAAIDFAENVGPKTAIEVAVPPVADEQRLALVRERLQYLVERAIAKGTDKKIASSCIESALHLLGQHPLPTDESLSALDRLLACTSAHVASLHPKVTAAREKLARGETLTVPPAQDGESGKDRQPPADPGDAAAPDEEQD